MTSLAVVIDTAKVQAVADRLLQLNASTIGSASVRAVNAVAGRSFDESVKRMTSRVNLTESYVRDRMDLEPANDPRKVEAVIVAFRSGGRRPGTRPVNLRQYAMVQEMQPTNWLNSGQARSGGGFLNPTRMHANPRKPGGRLPFKKRKGDPQAGIPLGQKAAGVSVEVVKGDRKTINFAFQRRMPNGEILVMARKAGQRGPGKGKGKIEALYSLSVWQLFRTTSAQIIPLIAEDLERTVGDEVENVAKEILK